MAQKLNYLTLISVIIVWIVKILVIIYDVITLPIYAVLQKPWIRYKKAEAVRAQQVDPDDPGSPWVRIGSQPTHHFSDDCKTVDEAIRMSVEVNGRDKQCLGYREVMGEEVSYSEGKPITKYVLSDYKWITYGEFDERLNNVTKGLLLTGVKSGDRVMIFADTSIDWFTTAQAVLRMGATVATLYSSLNEDGKLTLII